ncbi:RDD family protein [Streptomyces vinaceus]|uniref:RDD family protein n=1 Tax=Streptomyces vinaceus TaxID=1960 RepID=UPI0035E15FDF
MTASPGDGEHAAREGYYPDPSIPGFVRYWNGLNWVPGTSRPAAATAAAATAAAATAAAPSAAARSDETGPVFLDETGMSEALAQPAAPAVPAASWQADPLHQSGFGGPRDHRVSWGSPAQPEPDEGHAAARSAPAGLSPGRGPRPEPLEPAERAERGPGVSFARTPSATAERFPAQAAVRGSAESVGILSARSPAAAPAQAPAPALAPAPAPVEPEWPVESEWPAAPGTGAGPSGLTSSWPQTPLRRETAPEPETPAGRAAWPESGEDRAARPEAPGPSERGERREPGTPAWRDPDAGYRPGAAADPFAPEAPSAAQAPVGPRSAPAARSAPGSGHASAASSRRAGAGPALADPTPEAGEASADRLSPGSRRAAAEAERAPDARPAPAGRRPGAGPADGRGVPRVTDRAVFERMAERATRPAGLVRRAAARTLDTLVYGAVAAAAARPLLPAAAAHLEAKVDAAKGSGRTTTVWLFDTTIAGYLGLVLAAVLLFGVFYEALPTARWGRTPGKKLLGIRVLSAATLRPPAFGAALRRWLVYALLGLPGSLWCLGDGPRRRGWHDRAAKTYVSR